MEEPKDGEIVWAKFGSECFWPAQIEKDPESEQYRCHFLGEETYEPVSKRIKFCCWGCDKEDNYKEKSKRLSLVRQHLFARGLMQAERILLSARYQKDVKETPRIGVVTRRARTIPTPCLEERGGRNSRQKIEGSCACYSVRTPCGNNLSPFTRKRRLKAESKSTPRRFVSPRLCRSAGNEVSRQTRGLRCRKEIDKEVSCLTDKDMVSKRLRKSARGKSSSRQQCEQKSSVQVNTTNLPDLVNEAEMHDSESSTYSSQLDSSPDNKELEDKTQCAEGSFSSGESSVRHPDVIELGTGMSPMGTSAPTARTGVLMLSVERKIEVGDMENCRSSYELSMLETTVVDKESSEFGGNRKSLVNISDNVLDHSFPDVEPESFSVIQMDDSNSALEPKFLINENSLQFVNGNKSDGLSKDNLCPLPITAYDVSCKPKEIFGTAVPTQEYRQVTSQPALTERSESPASVTNVPDVDSDSSTESMNKKPEPLEETEKAGVKENVATGSHEQKPTYFSLFPLDTYDVDTQRLSSPGKIQEVKLSDCHIQSDKPNQNLDEVFDSFTGENVSFLAPLQDIEEKSVTSTQNKGASDEWDDSSFEGDGEGEDDLPPAFTPVSKGEKDFKPGDVVWARFNRYPYWPAIIYRLDHGKKRRKALVCFFDESVEKRKVFGVSTRSLLPFVCDDETRRRIEEKGQNYKGAFNFAAGIEKAEDFIRKKALGKVTDFFLPEDELEPEFDDDDDQEDTKDVYQPSLEFHRKDAVSREPSSPSWLDLINDNIERELRPKTKTKRHQHLLDAIRKSKSTLIKITRREVHSERHRIFMDGSSKEKSQLKYRSGFGPIKDGDTQSVVMELLINWFKEACSELPFNAVTYISDVWLPEAVIRALSIVRRVSFANAEKLYLEG